MSGSKRRTAREIADAEYIQDSLSHLPPVMTVAEAAEAIKLSKRHVLRLIARGSIRVLRTGASARSRVLIPRQSLIEFLTVGP